MRLVILQNIYSLMFGLKRAFLLDKTVYSWGDFLRFEPHVFLRPNYHITAATKVATVIQEEKIFWMEKSISR